MTNAALRVLGGVLIMLACIVTGEVSVVPQAAPAVAQVAMNRLDAGIAGGWHCIADAPADWAWSVAWEAWLAGGDAGGDLFALSEADMATLGFDKRNWEQVGSDRWPVWVGKDWQ